MVIYIFDFGIPLEDICPPQDLHPKLKMLLSEIIMLLKVQTKTLPLKYILKYQQGTLKERLTLKNSLIFLDNFSFAPKGAYLWVLRHFLGLLPLPLLPTYSCGHYFNWNIFDKKFDHNNPEELLIQQLHLLPTVNFQLLNLLMNAFFQISNSKFDIIDLIKYFAGSIFERPYRPGLLCKNKQHYRALYYLITRWNCKICNQIERKKIILLKNVASQTEFKINYKKDANNLCSIDEEDDQNKISDKTELDELRNNEDYLEKNEQMDGFPQENEEEKLHNATNNNSNQIIADILEESTEDTEHTVWSKILAETKDKVKKIEEIYIYDDYETFTSEDYNQIIHGNKSTSIEDLSYFKYSDVDSICSVNKTRKKITVGQKLFTNNTQDSPMSIELDNSDVNLPTNCPKLSINNYYYLRKFWSFKSIRITFLRLKSFKYRKLSSYAA